MHILSIFSTPYRVFAYMGWIFCEAWGEKDTQFEQKNGVSINCRVLKRGPRKLHEVKFVGQRRRKRINKAVAQNGQPLLVDALRRRGGGGDGTCTRVPTQDYLTFFAYSLLSNSQWQDSKPTRRCLRRKEFRKKSSRRNRPFSICVVLRRTFRHAKERKPTRWLKLGSECHSRGTAGAIVSV